jgi:hypothetical protein
MWVGSVLVGGRSTKLIFKSLLMDVLSLESTELEPKTRFCPKKKIDGKEAAQKIIAAMRKKTTLSANAAEALIKNFLIMLNLGMPMLETLALKRNFQMGPSSTPIKEECKQSLF